jgi:thiopurine S-methyltransferase
MTQDFWIDRWNENKIGFHQEDINQHLITHFGELEALPGGRVLVPLCGKSRDMIWLRSRGVRVVGVELSRKAVEAFFEENSIAAAVSEEGPFVRYEADGIVLLCGDFFELRDTDIAGVTAVYDRAALIALPRELRVRYAQHLTSLLAPGAHMLLLTFEYPPEEMEGPAFSVDEREVEELFAGSFSIEHLSSNDVLNDEGNERFRERGLTKLVEKVYGMVRG